MLSEAIQNFPAQFTFEPIVEGEFNPNQFSHFVMVGMGGSHLAADILKEAKPELDIRIHSDYGLPLVSGAARSQTLFVLCSYSGNTEEVLEAAVKGKEQGLAMIAIAVGGQLIEWAKAEKVPYVQLPNTGIQPRSALGFSLRALCKAIGAESDLVDLKELATKLDVKAAKNLAAPIAEKLFGKVPVIYVGDPQFSIAYNWKIKFNENTKIPAFCNRVPELNHNEMNGFDVIPSTKSLSENLVFIFLRSNTDHPNNQKRFTVLQDLYQARNLSVISLDLTGETFYERVFNSLLIADWVTVLVAEHYGIDPEPVPMVEEFKKLIAR